MTRKSHTADSEREQDELILASIIAGGASSRRAVRPAASVREGTQGHANGYGQSDQRGPCCAVGAGIIFHGLKIADEWLATPLDVFAARYGVSPTYAKGVSDGFEFGITDIPSYLKPGERKDYKRGQQVGNAAYDFFGPEGKDK